MKLFARAALLSLVATALAPLSGCCWAIDGCLACTNCLLGPALPFVAEASQSDEADLEVPQVTHAVHMAY